MMKGLCLMMDRQNGVGARAEREAPAGEVAPEENLEGLRGVAGGRKDGVAPEDAALVAGKVGWMACCI